MATITIYGASDDLVEVEIQGEDGQKGFEADAYDCGRTIFLTMPDGPECGCMQSIHRLI